MVPSAIALALVLAVGVYSHDDESALVDGPCPTPTPKANFKPQDIAGDWYDTFTNYALFKPPFQKILRNCMKNAITVEPNDKILIDTEYTDPDGKQYMLHKQWVPIEGKTGVYMVQIKAANDSWIDHGWLYTFEAFSGDSFMEFACKLSGTKHYEFHRIRSRSNSPPDSEIEALKQIAAKDGDHNDFVKINQSDCHYTLR